MSARTIAIDEPLSCAEIAQAIDILRGPDHFEEVEIASGLWEHDPTGHFVSRCSCGCGEVTVSVVFLTRRRATVDPERRAT